MLKIFSGIRPSGKLHLGNYLGAIKNWVELQNKADQCLYAVVDYHGITTPFDPRNYRELVRDTVLDFLAAGVNPEKSLLIRQSKISEHTELAWIFSTITPVSWLDRLPTYKEKLKENPKYHHTGLLTYPVLMAADILVYKSNLVPVGEDQLPHIDLANEIAKKFNHMFGETFEPIKAHLTEGARPHTITSENLKTAQSGNRSFGVGTRIMSLQDPSKKMSKSGDEGIGLTDGPDEISEKIKKAVTDSGTEIKYDPENKPAISNLMTIYHLLSGKSLDEIQSDYEGKTYVDFKKDLIEVMIEFLKPIQEKYDELKNDLGEVEKILTKSEEKAKNIANSTLTEIKQKMGLI